MAKYRITSIPQKLPKAQLGWFKNRRKKISGTGFPKRNKSSQDAEYPEETWEPQTFPGFANTAAAEDLVPKRTTEEIANTVPLININSQTPIKCPAGQYDYNGQCVTEDVWLELYNRQRKLDAFHNNQRRDEDSQKRRDAITKLDDEINRQREINYTDKYFKTFEDSKKSDKIKPFHTITLDQLNKKIQLTDAEGNVILDEKTGKPKEGTIEEELKKSFLINKKEDGSVDLYPNQIVYDRIISNGFRADQFENAWGLDRKQVESQVGDLMKAADEQYSATMQSQILEKAEKEGISIEEAAKKLSGKKRGNLQKFVEPTKTMLNSYIDQLKTNTDLPGQEPIKSMYYDNRDPNQGYSPEIDHNNPDPLKYNLDYYNTTGNWGKFLKDYSDYNSEYGKSYDKSLYGRQNKNNSLGLLPSDRLSNLQRALDLIDQNILSSKRVNEASTAANETIYKDFIDQYQNEIANAASPFIKNKLKEKLEAVKNNPAALAALVKDMESGKALTEDDFTDAADNATNILKNQASFETPAQLMYDSSDRNLSTGEKVWDVVTNPFDAFRYSNQGTIGNMWDKSGRSYNERKNLERAYPGANFGTEKNNLVGNFINTWNPARLSRDVDADIDRGDYGSAGAEVLNFASPFMLGKALSTAKFAKDANKLLGLGKSLPATRGFIGSGFNSLTPYFAYEAVRPGGNFNKSYDAFNSGDIGTGIEEGIYGTLGLLGAKGASRIKEFKDLTKPYNPRQMGFKHGGQLPTYQGPLRSIVKGVSTLGKTIGNLNSTQKSVSKLLSDNVYKNILTQLQPEKMQLISDLKNEGLLSKTLNEGALVNYPNLLDLATKKGIQSANTVFRSTRPFLGNSNILRSSENTETELPLQYANYLKGLPSDEARAAYMSSYIPPVTVGARVGIENVVGPWTNTDALYYSRQNVEDPKMEYVYGPLQTELRFPFDFSEGNASDWLQRYRQMPFRYNNANTSLEAQEKLLPPKVGDIVNWDYFSGSRPGSEGAILGLRNQRALEPVRVRYNQAYKELEDEQSLNDYFYDIMSNRSPEEQNEFLLKFNQDILPELSFPKDRSNYFGKQAKTIHDAGEAMYISNRHKRDLVKNKFNVKVTPYSPFSFGFEEGGMVEVELTPKQIKEYVDAGYIIEDQ